MGRRRGFFAELQYQSQLAAKQRVQAERAQARAHAEAVRAADRAQRAADRAATVASRASAAEQRTADREAKRLHARARLAEVDALNTQLARIADELDSILFATLDVDDFVDLDSLRPKPKHPPFPRTDLEVSSPAVIPISAPPEPSLVALEPPKGLGSLLGGKKKHAAAVAAARMNFDAEHRAWEAEVAAGRARGLREIQEREAREEQRLRELQVARDAYASECQARQAEAAEANERLDALIAGLESGTHVAVQEYVGIVLGNSVYPELLAVEHDYEFEPESRELTLSVLMAPPNSLPSEKAYRYVKAPDQITATPLSQKDLKGRYAKVVHQVALRTLHEVFEADRAGQVQTITLEVATEAVDPATGRLRRIVFVGVAAERDSFRAFDLHNVVPAATLEHLGAAMSKNPFELVGIDGTPGVRGR
jgi:restriction system protein